MLIPYSQTSQMLKSVKTQIDVGFVHGHIDKGVVSIDLPDGIATAILFGSKRSINFTEEDFVELKDLIIGCNRRYEAKEIMSKFDELYGIMASSTNVKYMHVFGNTMRCMMKDMASKHPELAQEYLDKLCAIRKNYLTKKEASEIVNGNESICNLGYADRIEFVDQARLMTEEKPYYNDYALRTSAEELGRK